MYVKLSSINDTRTVNMNTHINRRSILGQTHQLTPHESIVSKARDDGQILDRLTQQAHQWQNNERLPSINDHRAVSHLESALNATSNEHMNRHGVRIGVADVDVSNE
jgi:hypothetical protein